MEAATLVSIAPCIIRETKPILPSEFFLAKGSFENPSILLVGKGINDIYVGEERGQAGPKRSVIRVPVEADVIAAAIVVDWQDAQYGTLPPDAIPGFFWVPGHVTIASLGKELIEADQRQQAWFKNLVKLADDDWNKFRQHKTISDIQRYACNALKLERPWLLDNEIVMALSECPSCFEKVHPKAIVCSHCSYILDEERHKAMTYARA
jgi:hypothetical protein